MSDSTKRILSTAAIVIASVTFGVLVSADLGLMPESKAQTTTTVQTPSGVSVPSVTIPSFADLAARATPAVVSIRSVEIVSVTQRRRGNSPFDFFFPDRNDPRLPPGHPGTGEGDDEEARRSGGSGFIISSDGFILTNNHVVEDATRVEVTYGADENGAGGRSVPATIVGRDPATDIALLKIDVNEQLPALRLGDSQRIRRGDWAIAIGNPLMDFANSLTVGVVSGKGRRLGGLPNSRESVSFEDFIQTDAAINQGNSGGPLLNIAGEVIGINTAISTAGQGLGFATPINTAKILIPQLKQGKVTRGYLGMEIQDVTQEVKEAFDLPEARGALVQRVTPGRPAEKAGIKRGDVIIGVDDRQIRTNRELIDYISYLPVGTNVKVMLIRNGERMTVSAKTAVRVEEGSNEAATEPTQAEPAPSKLGMSVQGLTPETRRIYGIDNTVTGVLVTDVKNVSAAADALLREGDVIQEVQGQKVENLEQFRAAVDRLKSGQRVRMYVTTATRQGNVSRYTFLLVP
ncbi:MAG: trypsin-like peptidase domain-containing protein [Thermoanaerobaculia bacterium]